QKKRTQKDEPRPGKGGRLRRAAVVVFGVALLSAAVVAGLFLSGLIGSNPSVPRAAIVDQLSLTQSNPEFAASATDTLEQAGYAVDYFPGEQVTVEFYRNLPTHDYDLIILRVHSGMTVELDAQTGQETATEYVTLFTGEPYREDKYAQEQIGRLGKAHYYEGAPPLFGIAPGFITDSMRGSFDEALIVLMGCDGLKSATTAKAFLDKGASAFVSWTEAVSASHTDAATLRLLEHLLVDNLPIQEATARTMADVGPDPMYGAELRLAFHR
ncbi:MAG: hypothetical protein AMJ76_00005, partial [Dehalococcoidia bacterium SM23_28_1]